MKKLNFILILVFIIALIIGLFQTPYFRLQRDYPAFLEIDDEEFINKKLSEIHSKESLSDSDMETLWKLLWAKKDNFRNHYLSTDQRIGLIEKSVQYSPSDIYHAYLKFNVLKYKLGVNNLTELSRFSSSDVCAFENLTLDHIQKDNLFEMSAYFDILHFCEIDYTDEDIEYLNTAIKKSNDFAIKKHALEHGVNDVPVYVNNCSMAKGMNEKYHCLFFYSGESREVFDLKPN